MSIICGPKDNMWDNEDAPRELVDVSSMKPQQKKVLEQKVNGSFVRQFLVVRFLQQVFALYQRCAHREGKEVWAKRALKQVWKTGGA